MISCYNLPIDYISFLRKTYPNCKIVKVYRDLVSAIVNRHPQYKPELAKDYFDLLMSYDSSDAKKYNMYYFDEIESKISVPKAHDYPISDIFIAAKAKDRLPKILRACEIFNSAGLKCDFYLTGVPKQERIHMNGITYAEKNMPYPDMLYRSVNSRCMFEINQDGAVGYTSRFLEAVIYNKRIITDNPFVLQSKYYNERFVQVINSIDDIDTNFIFQSQEDVDYKYENDFSPINLIKMIDSIISNE